jgi:magnesium chelatase family protein
VSLARVTAFALDGVESRRVWVEADIRAGLPGFTIVGLADKAVREARERVRAAVVNSGFEFPLKRITINLAPAYLRKVGPSFDLSLAVAVLAASGQLTDDQVEGCAFAGELSLDGALRPVRGALAVAEGCREHGVPRLVLPLARAREAALVDGVEIAGADSLAEVVAVLRADVPLPPIPEEHPAATASAAPDEPDLSDVRGHNALIAALTVAVAGGHNLHFHGPPGLRITGRCTTLSRHAKGRTGSRMPRRSTRPTPHTHDASASRQPRSYGVLRALRSTIARASRR